MDWKLSKKIVGALLIVLGLLAFLTPLTPGAWLFFVGAELFGIEMLSHRRVSGYYKKLRTWFKNRKEIESEENEEEK